MDSSHNINSRLIIEHSKIQSDTRVEIEELVFTVSLVKAIIDVHYA